MIPDSNTYKMIEDIAARLHQDCGDSGRCHLSGFKEQLRPLIQALRCAMYPEIFGAPDMPDNIETRSLLQAWEILTQMLTALLPSEAEEKAMELIRALPDIRRVLDTDVQAAYEGDPAAKSTQEIMLAYPAFEAISIFRLAHKLYTMGVPILPRMMTEYAHRITGIDIHPGATIGEYFFIDHGTGVVIGETTTVGRRVKLYQGVTLGAKSFQVAEDGTLVKGIKRHPDIGNGVVVYAGATILGGSTVIGDNAVIGGNVWLTHSVPAGETVIAAHGIEQKNKI